LSRVRCPNTKYKIFSINDFILAFYETIIKAKSLSMDVYRKKYDIIVVGAGHAGCEAALAAARILP
jgi:NADPH-dependent 2,4-dienoyl-CoA reductase/sulfur reductase-like enzyme